MKWREGGRGSKESAYDWKKRTEAGRYSWPGKGDRHENFKPAGVRADRQKSWCSWCTTKSLSHQQDLLESYAWGDTDMQVSKWISARWPENRQMLHHNFSGKCGLDVKTPWSTLLKPATKLLKSPKMEKKTPKQKQIELSHMQQWLHAWRPFLPSSLHANHQTTDLNTICISPKVRLLVLFSCVNSYGGLYFRGKCETEV